MEEQYKDAEHQERIRVVFAKLEKATEDYRKQAVQAAKNQNAIAMNHMYSGPEKQMMFKNALHEFENKKAVFEIHKQLLDVFKKSKTEAGHFPNITDIISGMDSLIQTAILNKESRIAEIVKEWKGILMDEKGGAI